MFAAAMKRLTLAGLVSVALISAQAEADGLTDTPKQAIDIPAGDLAASLELLAKQSGVEFVYDATQLKGIKTHGVSGNLTPKAAVMKLLEGTTLTLTEHKSGAILISAPQTSAPRALNAVPLVTDGLEGSAHLVQSNPASTSPRANPDNPENANVPAIGSSTSSDSEKDKISEIVVTGTHIRGVENRTNPLIVIDRTQIEQSGYSATQEIFQSLPQNYASGATTQAGFLGSGTNNFQFASGINLRGLGPSSTLVLLNGHRMAPAVVGTEVDVSSIPLAAIERIEILTDGASAIYGSDAVGGVVNIITKKDYEGAETAARYGGVTAGSRQEETFAQILGTRWSTGNAAGTIQYQNHSALNARERSFASDLPGPSDLLPEDETYSGTLTARQQLTDRLEAYTDVLWSKRHFDENISATVAPPDGIDKEHNKGYSEDLNVASGVKYGFSSGWSAELDGLYATQRFHDAELLSGFFYPAASVESLTSRFVEKSVDAILNGKIAATAAGDIAIAVGTSYRDENPEYRVDIDGVSALQTRPVRTVKAYYGEIYVPIFGQQNSRPFLQALDVSAAVRADKYSDFGSTTNPRFGALWSPVPGLSFRASYGTSFRAPTESEDVQRLNPIVYIASFAAPNGAGVVPAIVSSVAKRLTAERAKSVNVGAEYRPPNFEGADFTLNYYDIRYTDRIIQIFPPFNALQTPNVYGQLITTLPSDAAAQAYLDAAVAAGAINYGDQTGTGMGTAGVRYVFNGGIQNASIVRQSGLDLLASITRSFSAGSLTTQFNASFVDKIDTAYSSEASPTNLAGTYGNPPKWRMRMVLGWGTRPWEASGAISTVGSYSNTAGLGNPAVSSWTTVDLSARLHVEQYMSGSAWKGVTLAASVLNVFDRNPPYINLSSGQTVKYDPSNASPLGRFAALELRKKW